MTVARPFRVIDTGIRDGRAQIAFDQALIELHKVGEIPDTLRFLQFPPTALIGRHQDLSKELKLDWCRANGVGIVRRITGGGALYFDEKQLGWELCFDRSTLGIDSLPDLARAICEAAVQGISRLGVAATYRPPNDIVVDGRKISGTGGFFDGATLFYQGTLLVDMDPSRMMQALNLPQPAPGADSGAPRVTTLAALLGAAPPMAEVKAALVEGFAETLGIAPQAGEITEAEETLARHLHDEEIGTDDFVAEIDDPGARAGTRSATRRTAGGEIGAHVRLEGPADARIREVLITGDFLVTPPRVILDLEAALRGRRTGEAKQTVTDFFRTAEVGLMTVTADDVAATVAQAVAAE